MPEQVIAGNSQSCDEIDGGENQSPVCKEHDPFLVVIKTDGEDEWSDGVKSEDEPNQP